MKWLPLLILVISSSTALGRGQSNPQTRVIERDRISGHFDNATEPDLNAIRERYREEACFNRQGLSVSCGERSEWDQGDPTYNWDPYFQQIPRGTNVEVDIQCNADTGKFEMNVKLNLRVCAPGADGQADLNNCRTEPRYMHNPYTNGGTNWISTTPTRWDTSPGLFRPGPYNNSPTTLPVNQRFDSDRAVVTEYHRVSDAQPWAGAPMFHAVWVRGGIAIHGSGSVDGYARSGGCIRLSQSNAMAFFRLARRVGTRNISYNWSGYGPGEPPACATPPEIHSQVIASREATTQEDRDRALAELEAELLGQMASEGRVRAEPAAEPATEEGPEWTRAVDSVENEKTPAKPGFFESIKSFFKKFF